MKQLIALLCISCVTLALLPSHGQLVSPPLHAAANRVLDRVDAFVLEQHTLKRYREANANGIDRSELNDVNH